jgi:hypothetical protein
MESCLVAALCLALACSAFAQSDRGTITGTILDPNKQLTLNPAAWTDPAPGTWGASYAYYSDCRSPRTPAENMSFGRIFRIREGITMEVWAEFINIFNRVELPAGTSTNALATTITNSAGVVTSGFGYINATAVGGQRTGVMLARFQF